MTDQTPDWVHQLDEQTATFSTHAPDQDNDDAGGFTDLRDLLVIVLLLIIALVAIAIAPAAVIATWRAL